MADWQSSLVFVSGVPSHAQARDIGPYFSRIGRVLNCFRERAYIFVEFDRPEEAERAVHKLNGTVMINKRVRVELSFKHNGFRDNVSRDRYDSHFNGDLRAISHHRNQHYATNHYGMERSHIGGRNFVTDRSYDKFSPFIHRDRQRTRYTPPPSLPPIVGRRYSPRSGRELTPVRFNPSHIDNQMGPTYHDFNCDRRTTYGSQSTRNQLANERTWFQRKPHQIFRDRPVSQKRIRTLPSLKSERLSKSSVRVGGNCRLASKHAIVKTANSKKTFNTLIKQRNIPKTSSKPSRAAKSSAMEMSSRKKQNGNSHHVKRQRSTSMTLASSGKIKVREPRTPPLPIKDPQTPSPAYSAKKCLSSNKLYRSQSPSPTKGLRDKLSSSPRHRAQRHLRSSSHSKTLLESKKNDRSPLSESQRRSKIQKRSFDRSTHSQKIETHANGKFSEQKKSCSPGSVSYKRPSESDDQNEECSAMQKRRRINGSVSSKDIRSDSSDESDSSEEDEQTDDSSSSSEEEESGSYNGSHKPSSRSDLPDQYDEKPRNEKQSKKQHTRGSISPDSVESQCSNFRKKNLRETAKQKFNTSNGSSEIASKKSHSVDRKENRKRPLSPVVKKPRGSYTPSPPAKHSASPPHHRQRSSSSTERDRYNGKHRERSHKRRYSPDRKCSPTYHSRHTVSSKHHARYLSKDYDHRVRSPKLRRW